MSRTLIAIITSKMEALQPLNPETAVASQGHSLDEALANLKEALVLYFEEASESSRFELPHTTFLTTVTL